MASSWSYRCALDLPRLRVDQMMRFEVKFLCRWQFITLALASWPGDRSWYFFPG